MTMAGLLLLVICLMLGWLLYLVGRETEQEFPTRQRCKRRLRPFRQDHSSKELSDCASSYSKNATLD